MSKKSGLLRNIHGEPDQLLIIQWSAAIFLSFAIGWNALVDAYLGHEPRYDKDTGAFVDNIPTRFHPVGADTLLFLIGIAGGSGSMYNWRRGQDRKTEVEKERIKAIPPLPVRAVQARVGAGGVPGRDSPAFSANESTMTDVEALDEAIRRE